MWTSFKDMHSGGGTKEETYQEIYIEAPKEEAEVIFYNRFGHSPNRVSCTCCGNDYSITESSTLEQATAYDRGCEYKGKKYVEKQDANRKYIDYITLAEYLEKKVSSRLVSVIRKEDIKPDERVGGVPEQGYVWMD